MSSAVREGRLNEPWVRWGFKSSDMNGHYEGHVPDTSSAIDVFSSLLAVVIVVVGLHRYS